MFEAEYTKMIDSIVPSAELISEITAQVNAEPYNKRSARQISGRLVLTAVMILALICATAIALTPPKVVNWSGDTVPGVRRMLLR